MIGLVKDYNLIKEYLCYNNLAGIENAVIRLVNYSMNIAKIVETEIDIYMIGDKKIYFINCDLYKEACSMFNVIPYEIDIYCHIDKFLDKKELYGNIRNDYYYGNVHKKIKCSES